LTTSLHGESSDAEPRISRYPQYGTSAGQEAIELAATAGLQLDPWQRNILRHSLGERTDGTWTAFEVAVIVSRQNGKGAILEARELAGLILFGERLILHSAHEMKTASEAFRRVRDLFTNYDDLRRRVAKVTLQRGDEGIELKNGARLRFVARSSGSGRGFSGDCVILDEAYAVTADQIDAMLPTLSARPNPQVWYTSSPPLSGETGEQLFSVRERSADPRSSIAYFDFGAAGDLSSLSKVDLNDRSLWQAANPAWGIRVSERFVEVEREALTDEGFARERLGIWPRQIVGLGGVIDAQLWAQLIDPESRRTGDVALAVDVTPLRTHATIAMYGVRADGLGHVQVVTYGEGVDWVVAKLAEFKAVLDPVAIGLDPKGGASSLLGELEAAGITAPADPEHPERGDLALPLAHEVAQATGQFIDAAREKRLRHVGQAELTSAVANAKTRPLLDSIAWGRKQSDVDISPLVGVTLARWAYVTRINAKPKAQELTGSLMA
jgi:hypothetical protein